MTSRQNKRNIYTAILLLCHVSLVIIANFFEGRHLLIKAHSVFSNDINRFDLMNFRQLGVFNIIMLLFVLAMLIYLIVRLCQHFRWKLIPLTLTYLFTLFVHIGAFIRYFYDVSWLGFCLKLNNIIISAPTGHGCDGYKVCLCYLFLLIISFSLIAFQKKEQEVDDELELPHIFNVKHIEEAENMKK